MLASTAGSEERMPPGSAAGRGRRMLRALAAAIIAVIASLVLAGGAASGPEGGSPGRWDWPVAGAPVVRPFVAPAHRYGAGHRGIDLAAEVGATVVAPTSGVVVFSGRVVDRGVLTLDAGDGVIVTVEPIASASRPGDAVARGDPLGSIDVGGHAIAGAVHLGVRVDGEYVDPMRWSGGVERAVLLPCC